MFRIPISGSFVRKVSVLNNSIVNHARSCNSKYFHQTAAILTNLKIEKRYKKKDQVPEKFSLIYRAPMEYYVACCKHFTSFSATTIALFTVYNYVNNNNIIIAPDTIATLAAYDSDFIYFAVGFVLINTLISVMISRYPLRIYKNDKDYTAVFEGLTPFKTKKVSFKQGEVTIVPPGGILPWNDARYKINKMNVLFLSEYFKTPSELNGMIKQYRHDYE